MKNTLFTLSLCIVLSSFCNAQWIDDGSNLTTTDNVGIGINIPVAKLDVAGMGHFYGVVNPTISTQGAYIGWNMLTGGLGETDFINHKGLGGGGFAFYNTGNDGSTKDLLMLLDGDGNLGIGHNALPRELLQLGDRWTFHNGGHKIIGYNYDFNGTTENRIVNDEAAAIRFVDDGSIHFQTSGNGAGGSNITWTEALSIKNDGNVGIGTTVPHANLHVEGYNLLLKNAGSSVHLRADGTHSFINNMDNFVSNGSTGNGDLVITGQQQLLFATGNAGPAGTIRMLIDGNGNVGIGTTNTGDWRLAVNGNIRAKEIVVETGWSDFVFENDYKLPTLEEVEQHIKTKGHLKDIPNAKEVEENGIQLGEMNSKLLQKIEELTLYLIEENKLNKELQDRIKKLETASIAKLKK